MVCFYLLPCIHSVSSPSTFIHFEKLFLVYNFHFLFGVSLPCCIHLVMDTLDNIISKYSSYLFVCFLKLINLNVTIPISFMCSLLPGGMNHTPSLFIDLSFTQCCQVVSTTYLPFFFHVLTIVRWHKPHTIFFYHIFIVARWHQPHISCTYCCQRQN